MVALSGVWSGVARELDLASDGLTLSREAEDLIETIESELESRHKL